MSISNLFLIFLWSLGSFATESATSTSEIIRGSEVAVSEATGKESCEGISFETKGTESLANATAWKNVANFRGTVSRESTNMLKTSTGKLNAVSKPTTSCPRHCELSDQPTIIFTSKPNKFLADYPQASKCDALLKETSAKPFEYSNRKFESVDSLIDWYKDFSQGWGKDGEDLYKRCDGDCSPQYSCVISKADEGFVMDSQVVCGHARDKNDNQYQLAYHFRWNCVDKDSSRKISK